MPILFRYLIRMLILALISFSMINVNLILHYYEKRFHQHRCEMSMNESDQYVCESDEKWQQRRIFYAKQHHNNTMTMNEYEKYFEKNWFPEFQCEHEIRLGDGDGGKWVSKCLSLAAVRTIIFEQNSINLDKIR